jgi:hypothetical protein
MTRQWVCALLVVLGVGGYCAFAIAAAGSSLAQGKQNGRRPPIIGRCTMALPATETTVEVQIPDAADFCELVSRALGEELFRAQMIVMPGRLWHYADATLSCRLRHRHTPDRITVHNSLAACRWLTGLSPGWHPKAGPKIAFLRLAATSSDSHVFVMNPRRHGPASGHIR